MDASPTSEQTIRLLLDIGHYPQSQRPDITTGAIQRFLESVPSRA